MGGNGNIQDSDNSDNNNISGNDKDLTTKITIATLK